MKLLVGTDLSENAQNAVNFALHLAKAHNSSITLLFAYSPVYDFAAQTAEYITTIEQQATKVLKSLKKTCKKEGIETSFLIEQKTPSSAICAESEKGAYDLIILGSQGKSDFPKKIFGSTTSEVIRLSSIPVLTVPASATFEAVDNISLAMELNREDIVFLGQLIALTRHYKLPYQIIHIKKDNDPLPEMPFSELSMYLKDRFPELSITFDTLNADQVNEGLQQYTQDHPRTLLTMFSKHRGFFDYLFRTSHCAEMALHSTVPLLVLKSQKS
ncbi:universal stress protein [Echinicola soli]|uniref:Universal stress protein n=1 Tax=Echinicola soli TaxID=2591634 RepID=A0A514CI96_9BACT|nr:universal stress protein [Echinicola soli]QDH79500.1 universal stress protein [Echinicola soli]